VGSALPKAGGLGRFVLGGELWCDFADIDLGVSYQLTDQFLTVAKS
tara:strand:- start:2485 stop:2622 length:138 start_codon:yes stop_codon:yes gene_type:complete